LNNKSRGFPVDAHSFCQAYEASGQLPRPIAQVIKEWETRRRNRVAEDYLGFETFLALLIADANMGDGLLDQISPDLLAAFTARRGENFDSYDEVRTYLHEMLARGDHSVSGVVSQIKGQIGEQIFKDQAGGQAYLAHATNQEAWDVAIPHAHGATEYVQVKIYHSADKAVEMMQEVHRKVAANLISDGENSVSHINFAVNEDIAAAVREKAAHHAELAGMKVYAIPVSNADATGAVVEGFNHIGPNELAHLFDEWFGGTLTATCVLGMTNAFWSTKAARHQTLRWKIRWSAPQFLRLVWPLPKERLGHSQTLK
jgi:hypothetical protein